MIDLTKLSSKELQDVIKRNQDEIKNLKVSLNAQVKISTIATNELNKAKGRIKDKSIKSVKEILQDQETNLKNIESQFKIRKFA